MPPLGRRHFSYLVYLEVHRVADLGVTLYLAIYMDTPQVREFKRSIFVELDIANIRTLLGHYFLRSYQDTIAVYPHIPGVRTSFKCNTAETEKTVWPIRQTQSTFDQKQQRPSQQKTKTIAGRISFGSREGTKRNLYKIRNEMDAEGEIR
eukprot:scaffold1352_cov144-Cylindrotheca_fusiformis.AAC.19